MPHKICHALREPAEEETKNRRNDRGRQDVPAAGRMTHDAPIGALPSIAGRAASVCNTRLRQVRKAVSSTALEGLLVRFRAVRDSSLICRNRSTRSSSNSACVLRKNGPNRPSRVIRYHPRPGTKKIFARTRGAITASELSMDPPFTVFANDGIAIIGRQDSPLRLERYATACGRSRRSTICRQVTFVHRCPRPNGLPVYGFHTANGGESPVGVSIIFVTENH